MVLKSSRAGEWHVYFSLAFSAELSLWWSWTAQCWFFGWNHSLRLFHHSILVYSGWDWGAPDPWLAPSYYQQTIQPSHCHCCFQQSFGLMHLAKRACNLPVHLEHHPFGCFHGSLYAAQDRQPLGRCWVSMALGILPKEIFMVWRLADPSTGFSFFRFGAKPDAKLIDFWRSLWNRRQSFASLVLLAGIPLLGMATQERKQVS